jgi:WD40 repeat protein
MARKRSTSLPVQVLLFLLVTLLGVATGNVIKSPGVLPWGLEFLRRESLPLAGITVLLIIGVMALQHRIEHGHVIRAHSVWDSERSPFPGLEAFTEQDSAVFFGRDTEIEQLLDRLYPVVPGRAHRLVTVVGPSGAGKSSLVQAGLVPRLRQRRGGWIVAPTVVPGNHPLHSLIRTLAAACLGHPIDGVLTVDFAEKIRAAERSPNSPVLVIVDQAEELITLSGRAERDDFLGLLARALDGDPLLWIIMIMRSEFLTAFLGTEQARLFQDPVTVGVLGHAGLVEVIEQPACHAGLTFDPPSLPQRMAADAGGGDALPLLAYVLQEMALAAGPEGVLAADAYQRLDGVTGVLTRQADKASAELGGTDPTGPVLATLLKFVTIGETEPTRRRVPRSTLTDTQRRVAEMFLAARLLSSHADGHDAILEVAHEALLRSWAPLRQAIQAGAEQLRWRADLERWARDWQNSGGQDAYLLRDERLKAAQRWAASGGGMLDGLAVVSEFLACSNRADRVTMQRLSETIARQALSSVDSNPDYSLLLAFTAYTKCVPTALAVRALAAALVASPVQVVFRGHGDEVLGVAWSPDGRCLATASYDRTVRIWATDTGNELTVLRGHDGWVQGVAWCPDGRRLATASGDQTVRIWDVVTSSELAVIRGHDDEVRGVAWSPDGRRLATGSRDRTVRIWDAEAGRELVMLCGHKNEVRGVTWSPDGQRLATGSHDRTVRIWDSDSGAELIVLHGHESWVQGVAWSPGGRRLASGSYDRTVRIWDTDTGSELMTLRGHEDEVRGMAWSPDGRRLASASTDRTARIWDINNGHELITLHGHTGWVRGAAWAPDGRWLATGSNDGTARIWDTRGGSELTMLHGHSVWVEGVMWAPNGQRLATASSDRTARIWDSVGGELLALRGHKDGVRRVAWSPDGRRLATASSDWTTRVWDADNGTELAVLDGHDDGVRAVAWSPDGRKLATVSRDRTLRIWDADAGSELAVLSGHDGEVWEVAWSPDGQRIASSSTDRTIRIWDTDHGAELVVLHGHHDWVWCVAWSPEGQRLVTASRDRTVRIWDTDRGTELAVLSGHDGDVRGVTWSPDGQQLATGSYDRTVRIWDAKSGTEIIVVGAHLKGVDSVSWSPDGRQIASASRDGTCRIWDATISIENLVANAQRRITRELTSEEKRNLMLPLTS